MLFTIPVMLTCGSIMENDDLVYELREEIKRLKQQITYLQEELASAEDVIENLRDELAAYDEGFM